METDSGKMLLENKWTMWVNTITENYENSLKEIYTVDSVKEFWMLYNTMPRSKDLKVGVSYHLMLDKVKPLWEDEGNEHGYTLVIFVKKNETEKFWKTFLMCLVGSNIDDIHKCNGISLVVKKTKNVIKLWFPRLQKDPIIVHDLLKQYIKLNMPEYEILDTYFNSHDSYEKK